ncbi:MAG: hypothetical protein GPOALKHO_000662 [Sodalis sp.]|nr:MAG: hypothetical protein GPOALKHO_000662 [Sodalis sp.]
MTGMVTGGSNVVKGGDGENWPIAQRLPISGRGYIRP